MASGVYNEGANQIRQGGSVDWDTDTIKIMLVDDGYAFDPDHDTVSDFTADEISVTGYANGFSGAGRKTLASCTVTKNTTDDRIIYDAADPSAWTLSAGVTIGGAIVYKHITDDATSVPIAFLDFTDTPTNGGTFTITFDAAGVFYLQCG
jgi:hypothetical protein